jgi:hypothetical protein
LSKSLSNILPNKGLWLIGLYEVKESSGLFDFGISMIFESFQRGGKWENLKDALKIWIIRIMVRFVKYLTFSAVTKSYSGDFLSEYFRIVNLTSLGDKCLTENDIESGESREEYIVSYYLMRVYRDEAGKYCKRRF